MSSERTGGVSGMDYLTKGTFGRTASTLIDRAEAYVAAKDQEVQATGLTLDRESVRRKVGNDLLLTAVRRGIGHTVTNIVTVGLGWLFAAPTGGISLPVSIAAAAGNEGRVIVSSRRLWRAGRALKKEAKALEKGSQPRR